MEAFFALIVVLVSSIGLGLAAVEWGADSRPGMADDHQR